MLKGAFLQQAASFVALTRSSCNERGGGNYDVHS